MTVAGPKFPPIAPYIEMLAIDVYGRLDGAIVERLREKARVLGGGVVRVHDLHDGFVRALEPAQPRADQSRCVTS